MEKDGAGRVFWIILGVLALVNGCFWWFMAQWLGLRLLERLGVM